MIYAKIILIFETGTLYTENYDTKSLGLTQVFELHLYVIFV